MKQQIKHVSLLTAAVALLGLAACNRDSPSDAVDLTNETADEQANILTGDDGPQPGRLEGTMANDYRDIAVEATPYATVEFNSVDGQRTSGNVQFIGPEAGQAGARVIGRLANLPEGTYSLRVLESGDCSNVTGIVSARNSAIDSAVEDDGSALPQDSGYLGHLSVGPDELAQFDFQADHVMLEGPNSIVGKPVIVGSAEDWESTAPPDAASAESGSAMACGVVVANDMTAAGGNP